MRVLARIGLVLAGSLLLAGTTALPAGAHADLLSTDPADGSSLTTPPTAVTLTFSEALVPETVNVALSNEMGPMQGIVPATEGDTVTIPWPAEVGDGDYTVAYRVVSEDGHPIEGSFAFTVAAAESVVEASAPAPNAVATPIMEASAAASAPYEPTGPEDGSVNWVMVIVVLGFGVAAFSALLVAGRKNARRKW